MSTLIGGNARQRAEHEAQQRQRAEEQRARNRQNDIVEELRRLEARLFKTCPTCNGEGTVARFPEPTHAD